MTPHMIRSRRVPILAAVVLVAGWVLQGPASSAGAASAGPERTLALDQNTNYPPDVAFDGTNHLVVWTRGSGSFADVVGTRVAPDGTVLDPGLIPIAANPNVEESNPAAVFDGSVFQVVFQAQVGNLEVFGTQVTGAGVVIAPGGAPIATGRGDQHDPDIAYSPTAMSSTGASLVVWTDTRFGFPDVFGTRLTGGFSVDGSGFPISNRGMEYRPAVAAVGDQFVVVWTTTALDAAGDIWGARVTSTDGATGVPIALASGSQVYPDVASDGTGALVVWQDRRNGTTDDVYATRWSPTGGVLDPGGVPVSTAPGSQSGPQVAWNGSYLVAWADYRNGAGANAYGARVTTAGAVSDPNGIPIGTRQSDLVAAARGTGNTWAVIYSSTGGSGVYFRTVSSK